MTCRVHIVFVLAACPIRHASVSCSPELKTPYGLGSSVSQWLHSIACSHPTALPNVQRHPPSFLRFEGDAASEATRRSLSASAAASAASFSSASAARRRSMFRCMRAPASHTATPDWSHCQPAACVTASAGPDAPAAAPVAAFGSSTGPSSARTVVMRARRKSRRSLHDGGSCCGRAARCGAARCGSGANRKADICSKQTSSSARESLRGSLPGRKERGKEADSRLRRSSCLQPQPSAVKQDVGGYRGGEVEPR